MRARWRTADAEELARRVGLQKIQDGSLKSLLRLWSVSGQSAVGVLSAWPAQSDEETSRVLCRLGGSWTGGTASLDVAVKETAAFKTKLVQERQAVLSASARSEGSAVRVDELFAMLAQQRANVAALAAVIRTSETELLCLQRSLALADDHAAELAACPRVSTDGMHTMLDPHAPRAKRAPRSPTSPNAIVTGGDGDDATGAKVPSPPSAPPSNEAQRAELGLPPKPPMPPAAELAGLVAASEAIMRTRMAAAEARCCGLEGRLSGVETKLRRAIEQVKQRRQHIAETEAEALFSPTRPSSRADTPTSGASGASGASDSQGDSRSPSFSGLAEEAEAASASLRRLATFDELLTRSNTPVATAERKVASPSAADSTPGRV